MQIGDIVYYTELCVPSADNWVISKPYIKSAEYKIIGISEYCICLDTPFFTTLSLKGLHTKACLDMPRVEIGDSMFDGGLVYTAYSSSPPNIEEVKAYIKEYLKIRTDIYEVISGALNAFI